MKGYKRQNNQKLKKGIKMNVVFITGNENKFKEASEIIPNLDRKKIDLDEIQGEETEIAKHKVKQAYGIIKGPVFVEDVSLRISSLGGLPGPYVKYFVERLGAKGIYDLVRHKADRSAQAICTVGFFDGENLKIVQY